MQNIEVQEHVKDLSFLWEVNKVLNNALIDAFNPQALAISLGMVFQMHLNTKSFKIFTFDEKSEEIRDFSANWFSVKSKDEHEYLLNVYQKLTSVDGFRFYINDNLIAFDYKQNDIINSINTHINFCNNVKDNTNVIYLPILQKNDVIGFLELVFSGFEKTICTLDFYVSLNIASSMISASIVNTKLTNQMKLSLEFHQVAKSIAKIIETQYELDYIIPLIGEMIDKFVPEPLIYIFESNDDFSYSLMWPASYNKDRLDNLIAQSQKKQSEVFSDDKTIAVFPLINDNNILGYIVADGKFAKLTEQEIYYIDQLSKQTSVTIDKANTYAEILKHATVDALTGIANRRQFEKRLKQEYSVSSRTDTPLCCMMIDIDFFKKVNDQYGHAIGDKVLQQFAEIASREIREYDILARYGGEEFAIILPQASIDKANTVAERLRSSVEKAKIDISEFKIKGSKTISITISIGICEFNKTHHNEANLLHEDADKALYQAKKLGRNRVEFYKHK